MISAPVTESSHPAPSSSSSSSSRNVHLPTETTRLLPIHDQDDRLHDLSDTYLARRRAFARCMRDCIGLWRESLCILFLAVMWTLPPPTGLTPTAMHLLVIFISVILALLITKLKVAVIVTVALIALTFTQSLACRTKDGLLVECSMCRHPVTSEPPLGSIPFNATIPVYQCDPLKDGFNTALSGFSLPLSWLVLCSFQIGKAVEITKLGHRVSLMLVRYFGKSVLGLGYAIFASELLLGPFLPSNTARGGGIVVPIVASLNRVLGSSPTTSPSIGRFLILCGLHANLVVSSLFLTATVANPVISDNALEILGVDFDFAQWSLGALIPGLCLILIQPVLFSWLLGANKDYDNLEVMRNVEEDLVGMGNVTLKEGKLVVVLLGCLTLWMGDVMPEALVAFCGLAALLCLQVLRWEDVVANSSAWDSFFWLSGMVLMAEQLSALKVTDWLGDFCSDVFENFEDPMAAAVGLAVTYFFSMYMFSSLTGHAVALVGPFMETGKDLGVPPIAYTAMLAYFSALSGCLTNYSSGATVIYYGQGFFPR
ncbi:hypothetical protein HDU76_007454, partial [Blyttiomyces sp. JEL0837]